MQASRDCWAHHDGLNHAAQAAEGGPVSQRDSAPVLEAVILAVGLAVAVATGVRVWSAQQQPTPPAVMRCVCPEATR